MGCLGGRPLLPKEGWEERAQKRNSVCVCVTTMKGAEKKRNGKGKEERQ